MVSFENGKFVLRRRVDKSLRSRRFERLRRNVAIVLAASFFYFLHGRNRLEADSSLLRAARHADVEPYSRSGSKSEVRAPSQDNEESDDAAAVSKANRQPPSSEAQDNDVSDDSAAASNNHADGKGNDGCNPALDKKFLQQLRSLAPMPKKVHIFFPDKNYWRKAKSLPFVQHSILSLKELNPDWNVTVYSDEMLDDVIRRAADSDLISGEERDILVGRKDGEGRIVSPAAHIVERSDVARLLLMYTEGGFYIDADRLIGKRMADVLRPNTRMCLPTFNDANFCQDLMCTSRGNDLFLSMVREASKMRVSAERRHGWVKGGMLYDMGPTLYNKQILIHGFGGNEKMYGTCEEYDLFHRAREWITAGADGIIVTKKETACDDGLLVDKNSTKCYDRGDLYAMYGMKSWSKEVNAVWA